MQFSVIHDTPFLGGGLISQKGVQSAYFKPQRQGGYLNRVN